MRIKQPTFWPRVCSCVAALATAALLVEGSCRMQNDPCPERIDDVDHYCGIALFGVDRFAGVMARFCLPRIESAQQDRKKLIRNLEQRILRKIGDRGAITATKRIGEKDVSCPPRALAILYRFAACGTRDDCQEKKLLARNLAEQIANELRNTTNEDVVRQYGQPPIDLLRKMKYLHDLDLGEWRALKNRFDSMRMILVLYSNYYKFL